MASHVTAAVDFGSDTDAVVRSAVSLARLLGMPVRLIHVIRPLYTDPADAAGVPDWIYPPAELVEREDQLRELARRRLAELRAKVPHDIGVTTAVLTDRVVPALLADANERGAAALVIGCHPDHYRRASEPFSEALSLMHKAAVPVLAVHEGAVPDFTKAGFRILVGDDLRAGGQAALRQVFTLATRLTRAQVHHTNVARGPLGPWQAAWTLLNRGDGVGTEVRADLVATSERRRMALLKDRGGAARAAAVAAGCRIFEDARTGEVAEEMERSMAEAHPDLLVFGRHEALHIRPFLIGRLPLRAMLNGGRPVLIVPPGFEG